MKTKEERSEYSRRWRAANLEKVRASRRRYRSDNLEKERFGCREYMRKLRIEHPERLVAARRRYKIKNKQKIRERGRLRYWRDPEKWSIESQCRKFGISREEYDALWALQGGVCAICKKLETSKSRTGGKKRLALDHDSKTGKVRGFLCNACNVSIGHFGDNIGTLLAAADYLRKAAVNG